MFFEMSKVIDNIKVCDNYFLLRIYNPRINFDFFPGQFLEIKISKSCNAFFKRPFAIFDLERDSTKVGIEIHNFMSPNSSSKAIII